MPAIAEKGSLIDPIDNKTCIVVVTYRRNDLLDVLFDSIAELATKPGAVFVVDNDASEAVGDRCLALQGRLAKRTGAEVPVEWIPMEENTGGAGGFSRGVATAFDAGFEWFWLMDDDVKVFPDALDRLQAWMGAGGDDEGGAPAHGVIQCSKLNFNGEPFYWQYRYWPGLCMLNPFAKSGFADGEAFKPMNTVCFEGGLFHRSAVARMGLPDPRFFIHWDDTAYGYVASKVTSPILVPDVLMQRTRETSHLRVGKVRKLNAASDTMRYHTMRNRGYLARYAKEHGDYNPLSFALGTCLVFAQELIRLHAASRAAGGADGARGGNGAGAGAGNGGKVAADGRKPAEKADGKKARRESMACLRRGMRDARAILHDGGWAPMPPFDAALGRGRRGQR